MKSATRPYADALYAVATDAGTLRETLEGLERLEVGLRAVPDAEVLLRQRAVRPEAAGAVLEALAVQSPDLVGRLLRLLFAKGRIALLPKVIDAYRARLDLDAGIVRGQMETARGAASGVEARVASAVGNQLGRKVVLRSVVRSDLVGGVRVVIADRVWDGSVTGRLSALRRKLSRVRAG